MARQARFVWAWLVGLRHGMAGEACWGLLGQGTLWHGTASNYLKKQGGRKMGMVYKWAMSSMYKASAEQAAEVFEELRATKGLTAKNLVEASRPEDAPLHDDFEWDDSVAAERYRETQGRNMIKSLRLVVKEKEMNPVRAYVTIDSSIGKSGMFEPIQVIMSEETKREKLFKIAIGELKAFRSKYDSISEFADLMDEIDNLIIAYNEAV